MSRNPHAYIWRELSRNALRFFLLHEDALSMRLFPRKFNFVWASPLRYQVVLFTPPVSIHYGGVN